MSSSKLTAAQAARYWGCEVVQVGCSYDPYTVNETILSLITKGVDYQLLLTPLSAITDEHAIEVAKVIMQSNSKEQKEYEWQIDRRDEEGVLIGDVSDPIATRILISSLCEFIGVDFMENPVAIMNQRPAIDLLRSLGYDCDNAISEGWAVDKRTSDNK